MQVLNTEFILCMLGNFHAFVVVYLLFSQLTFSENSFRNAIKCPTVWIQILSVLIWVETVHVCNRITTKVTSSLMIFAIQSRYVLILFYWI